LEEKENNNKEEKFENIVFSGIKGDQLKLFYSGHYVKPEKLIINFQIIFAVKKNINCN